MAKMSRRSFLKSSTAVGLGLMAGGKSIDLLAPRSAKAQEPVRILNGCTFSGAYAATGLYVSWGTKLAVKHFGGKVLGRPVEIIERDVPNPAEGVRKAQEAVERFGVKFLVISPTSSTVLAVSEYAARKGVILLGHCATDKVTGEACNKYTFRWQIPAWGAMQELVPRLIDGLQANSFYTITPEYVFGEDILRDIKEVLTARGKKFLGNSFHPMGETDYSSHITKAMAAKADCVVLCNFDLDTVNALKQAYNFGLQKVSKVAIAWGSGIQQMKAIGPKALEGIIWGMQYYHAIDTPKNKKLVSSFKEDYGEAPPYVAAMAYAGILTLLEVIERAGTTDPLKVAAAWEDYEYDGINGREKWRACDHQLIKPYYTIRCKAPEAMKDPEDFADIIGFSSTFKPCEKTGCKMPK